MRYAAHTDRDQAETRIQIEIEVTALKQHP